MKEEKTLTVTHKENAPNLEWEEPVREPLGCGVLAWRRGVWNCPAGPGSYSWHRPPAYCIRRFWRSSGRAWAEGKTKAEVLLWG